MPTRKFAQFNANFDQLDKQQKHLDKLQKQQQHQHTQLSNQEFVNPFPYYRHVATLTTAAPNNNATSTSTNASKQNYNSSNYALQEYNHRHAHQHQQSPMQRNFAQNTSTSTNHNHHHQANMSKHIKIRNHFLLNKLESSLINNTSANTSTSSNTAYESYSNPNLNHIHKKSSSTQSNNANIHKRRSTQVFNL